MLITVKLHSVCARFIACRAFFLYSTQSWCDKLTQRESVAFFLLKLFLVLVECFTLICLVITNYWALKGTHRNIAVHEIVLSSLIVCGATRFCSILLPFRQHWTNCTRNENASTVVSSNIKTHSRIEYWLRFPICRRIAQLNLKLNPSLIKSL